MVPIEDVLRTLRPGAQWTIHGGSVIVWLDTAQTQPTDQEMQAAIAQLQAQKISKDTALTQGITTLKDKNASTDDKLNALIQILGL